jgi:hypothetical protein
MDDELTAAYPEVTAYIWDAVDEHGEEWVLENYYQQIYPLKIVMDVPNKEELPFFDPDTHETMSQAALIEMYEAWGEYRENLRTGSKTTTE